MKTIVNKVRKPISEEEEKLANEFLDDEEQDKWESGKLGRDVEHMKISDMSLSGKPTSIRLSEELRNKLTSLARKKGLSTHSYIRMILIQHAEQMENNDKKAS